MPTTAHPSPFRVAKEHVVAGHSLSLHHARCKSRSPSLSQVAGTHSPTLSLPLTCSTHPPLTGARERGKPPFCFIQNRCSWGRFSPLSVDPRPRTDLCRVSKIRSTSVSSHHPPHTHLVIWENRENRENFSLLPSLRVVIHCVKSLVLLGGSPPTVKGC